MSDRVEIIERSSDCDEIDFSGNNTLLVPKRACQHASERIDDAASPTGDNRLRIDGKTRYIIFRIIAALTELIAIFDRRTMSIATA